MDYRGTGVALVTPFKEDLSIDYDSLASLIKKYSDAGVNYLVVNGTTGEASTLSLQEKNDILAFVKKINSANLPIVYGIGANNTQQVIDTINNTDLEGVSAILSVCPYYNKHTQEGIYRHY